MNDTALQSRHDRERAALDASERARNEVRQRWENAKKNREETAKRVADAVMSWVGEYVEAKTKDGWVSHHLTDVDQEVLLCAVLGDDIYEHLNEIMED